jgi:hypothetical protein
MVRPRSGVAYVMAALLLTASAPVSAQQARPLTENDRYVQFFDCIVFGS